MVYILKIGFHAFAFENSRGLDTVIRTLSKGMPVTRSFLEDEGKLKYKREEEEIVVKLETESSITITKGKGRSSWQPERVVVTPEVVRDELFGRHETPRQIGGPKCLPVFHNKAIRQ